ncbi:MAG: LysM peptidoglycan-binding domain-containing protein [Anaerolineae bacterium]|nr:LysM peptidoglycan-binding domain-containing protein [Anaerolineae bacterium]
MADWRFGPVPGAAQECGMTCSKTLQRHWQKLVWGGLLLSMLAMAGCYQPAGDTLEATSVSMIATFTPVPSETPSGPPSATPIQLIAITSTPDPLALAQTQIAAAQSQQVAEDPFSATATAMALGIGVSQPLEVTPADPMLQTATAMSRGMILPTTDPFGQPTLDPLFVTATAYITNATATAAAPMTQTMAALFPSLTPFVTQPPFFTPGATPPPTGTCTHTVQAGENLFRISLRYNTTVDAIAAANGIVNPQLIVVGQVLTIPGCGSGGGGGGTVPPPSSGLQPGEQMHVVRQNETLMTISLQYGVPVASIASRNALSNPNLIFINQELIIPVA